MSTAFIIGNGKSRLVVDLNVLKPQGKIYGCNALYRTFVPDCLVATDRPIAEAIQNSGYSKQYRFHTRKPIPGLGAQPLQNKYKGYSSGPNATALACLDGHTEIFLVGFDLGTTNGMFNNVYVDTQFYKKQLEPPTFSGNWVRQLLELAKEFDNVNFTRIEGPESAFVKQFNSLPNMNIQSMDKFLEMVNTRRGPL